MLTSNKTPPGQADIDLMDLDSTVEYKLRDLPTRSVTLFPTRAQIYRELKDVPLKPGDNRIKVIGLSPTVDKDSVKVEGSGLAVITDISVSQEDNHEIFEEVYPEFDLSLSDESSAPETSEDYYENDLRNLEELPELTEAKARYESLQDDLKAADEAIANATERLRILDSYGKSLGQRQDPVDIGQFITTYQAERQRMFNDQQDAERKKRQLGKELHEAGIKMNMYNARQTHERDMAEWKKQKERADQDKANERERRRKNHEVQKKEKKRKGVLQFWPKHVYSVCITLDASPCTPMSSRRNSTASEIELAKASSTTAADGEAVVMHCDLVLSYITTSAFWSPSYDMQLNTTSATGTLLFDAQLHNSTSETWSNCHVTLSTSQATTTSIEEPIPALVPWHIRLVGKSSHSQEGKDEISTSKEEQKRKNQLMQQTSRTTLKKPRTEMFNADSGSTARPLQDFQMQLMQLNSQAKKGLMMGKPDNNQARLMPQSMGQMQVPSLQHQNQMAQQQAAQQQSAFGGANAGNGGNDREQVSRRSAAPSFGGIFAANHPGDGALASRVAPAPSNAPSAAAIPLPRPGGTGPPENVDFDSFLADSGNDNTDSLSIANTASESPPALDFKDSLIEETGMTTAYDLPGSKTLVPRATSSKHRVARLTLSNVVFSYTIVPKYKPVAYLKAKIRNGSKLTLLRGEVGLTLDGGFMGRTTLPRCSAGETLTLGLGTDPAVKVRYSGPDVRRSATGLFSKEDSSVYTRTITLENTRSSTSSKPCHLFVHDQVPVSEDERLKVVVQLPRNLAVNAGSVKAGKEGAPGDQGKNWGEADAIMKETGTVTWNVSLNPGKAVKLELEYVVAMPSGGGHSAVSLR